jgi:hypothetical protein
MHLTTSFSVRTVNVFQLTIALNNKMLKFDTQMSPSFCEYQTKELFEENMQYYNTKTSSKITAIGG